MRVIVAAAVCPHPPLLLRELGGRDDVLADVRASCVDAVRELLSQQLDLVTVVGGAERTYQPSAGAQPDPRRFGVTAIPPPANGLPLSLAVAHRLLSITGWRRSVVWEAVARTAPDDECERIGTRLAARPGRVGLLVMADGSARHGPKAPGHHDDRAAGFDRTIVSALESGDHHALRAMDRDLADELLVQGRAALHVLGSAAARTGSVPKVRLHLDEAPFGVGYFVATWSLDQ